MYRTMCDGCGLDVNDLPDELGDRELVREQFFVFSDDGHLYCQGCIAAGAGGVPVSTEATERRLACPWCDDSAPADNPLCARHHAEEHD